MHQLREEQAAVKIERERMPHEGALGIQQCIRLTGLGIAQHLLDEGDRISLRQRCNAVSSSATSVMPHHQCDRAVTFGSARNARAATSSASAVSCAAFSTAAVTTGSAAAAPSRAR
jgi:hypothetical protein